MAIFSDLELERIMNEGKNKLDKDDDSDTNFVDNIKRNKDELKELANKAKDNAKNNMWITKKKNKDNGKDKSLKKVTFKHNAEGKEESCHIEGYDDYIEEGIKDKFTSKSKKSKAKIDDNLTDLTNKAAIEIEKEKQDWQHNPGAKTGEAIGDLATGGNIVNTVGKASGRFIGGKVDNIIKKQEAKRKKLKEDASNQYIYRSKEYTQVMNEFFDITDTETRKVLIAVNEADQNKVLVSLTSKLYENVVDKVDDIDFGEIEMTKGDITKLSNFNTLNECLANMSSLLIEFKQDVKPVDTIKTCISNLIDSKDIWTKAYAINVELPMITYNTMVLAVIEATAYMVSMCVEFIKSPSQDTIQIMIDKSALTKSKGHTLFKNIEMFNDAYSKGQVEKAMMHVIGENAKKKNFVGGISLYGIGAGAAVAGIVGLLFCIIPIIRELIFLFYYNRVRISEFFEVQADLLQVNAYNVENNRLDLTAEERKKISAKQMKVADNFRKIANKIAIDVNTAENSSIKEVKKEKDKKYKANEIMDELPDSASSALF